MINPELKKKILELRKKGLKIYHVPVFHKNYFLLMPHLWLRLDNFSTVGESVIPGVDVLLANTNVDKLDAETSKEVKQLFSLIINYGMSGVMTFKDIIKLLSGRETSAYAKIDLDHKLLRRVYRTSVDCLYKSKNNIVESKKHLEEGKHTVKVLNANKTKLLDGFVDYVAEECLTTVPDKDKYKFNLFLNILRNPSLRYKDNLPFLNYYSKDSDIILRKVTNGIAFNNIISEHIACVSDSAKLIFDLIEGVIK